LATEAGLPDGVLQVLPGPGGSLGRHLALHEDIDGLTFTGSTEVGKQLMQYSGESNLKRTFLESQYCLRGFQPGQSCDFCRNCGVL
jgi:acyl-CoA reductase-like NAD-dependent aldehyde dehydrogenase